MFLDSSNAILMAEGKGLAGYGSKQITLCSAQAVFTDVSCHIDGIH